VYGFEAVIYDEDFITLKFLGYFFGVLLSFIAEAILYWWFDPGS